ncbi:MAG: DUF503 domain-containing protein [Candidatus Krumholzibacteria bacterium]|nr:DUF503 domain-containing protein [Candidatus Krumholzibacteria bacterium]
MIVACLRVRLRLPDCHSLKHKRFVLKSLKDRLRSGFNVALCESGYQDKWQMTELSLVTVAGTGRGADATIQSIVNFLERDARIEVVECERERL